MDEDPRAILLDIRTTMEFLYVGHPPQAVNLPWYEFPSFQPDPHFAQKTEKLLRGEKDRTVILLCRSGKRTLDAGAVLVDAGFTNVINVLHGFEGDLDDTGKRNTINGWRHDGLEWEQT